MWLVIPIFHQDPSEKSTMNAEFKLDCQEQIIPFSVRLQALLPLILWGTFYTQPQLLTQVCTDECLATVRRTTLGRVQTKWSWKV